MPGLTSTAIRASSGRCAQLFILVSTYPLACTRQDIHTRNRPCCGMYLMKLNIVRTPRLPLRVLLSPCQFRRNIVLDSILCFCPLFVVVSLVERLHGKATALSI
jgi:hypothetical protein